MRDNLERLDVDQTNGRRPIDLGVLMNIPVSGRHSVQWVTQFGIGPDNSERPETVVVAVVPNFAIS